MIDRGYRFVIGPGLMFVALFYFKKDVTKWRVSLLIFAVTQNLPSPQSIIHFPENKSI